MKEDVQQRLKKLDAFMELYYDRIRKGVKEADVKNKLFMTLQIATSNGFRGYYERYKKGSV